MRKKGLVLIVMLGIVLLLSSWALAWTINDPEIKDLSGGITVRDFSGEKEFSLEFVYLNDRSLNHIFKSDVEAMKVVKVLIGDRNCLLVAVFAKQDSYFYPKTYITFVQGRFQYTIGSDDVMKITDIFSGKLRADTLAMGLIFIPDDIDIYSPMKIYYDDDYTSFSVPVEPVEKEDVGERIEKLKEEKAKLEKDITLAKKRIEEINEEIKKLETKTKIGDKD
ncbi:MAG TPA: hypothetical protein PLC16_11590 [Defluviitaleaceae bacterium]|jgi:hypothetical protein|nr:hypothetical protein [Defluviitaleaceae bacterium]